MDVAASAAGAAPGGPAPLPAAEAPPPPGAEPGAAAAASAAAPEGAQAEPAPPAPAASSEEPAGAAGVGPGDEAVAAPEEKMVAFPVGDWFLGPGDGGAGRLEEAQPADVRAGPAAKVARIVGAAAEAGTARPKPLPAVGYGGELQLVQSHRSPSLLFSDLTDTGRFTCLFGPAKGPREVATMHPQLEFAEPHQKVHVHLEDMASGPGRRVLWDGIYDMGGTGVLKGAAKPLGGRRPDFEKFCPPIHGPPHWYELTVTRAVPGQRVRVVEDFVGSQNLESYRPDHDPELSKLGAHLLEGGDAGSGCTVQ